jgi:Tol biopolymer transport system component
VLGGSWRLRLVLVVLSLLVLGLASASAQAAASVGITYESQRSDSAGQPGIWMMNADGTGQQGFIPGGSEASWSADGTHMIYETGTTHCTQQSGGGLVMVNADGTDPTSRRRCSTRERNPCQSRSITRPA